MKNNIKISVIIPAYNCEKYISKCIESVLNQTYKNFELIIINDGSKDNTSAVVKEYEKKNKNINFIEQKNMGVAKTRNKAIKIATGDYIAFMDNDDYIDNDYLEKLVEGSDNGKYDIVLSGYRRTDQNDKVLFERKIENYEWSKYVVVSPWAKIYKRTYLLEHDVKFLDNNIGEDIYFNFQSLFISDNVNIINYIGYNWFYNTKSVSNTIQKNIKKINVYKFLNECYKVSEKNNLLDKSNKEKYELVEMFYIKNIIWILFYSFKKLDYKTLSEEYDKIFIWLKEKFPDYKKNKLIGFNKPKGESKKNQIIYKVFMDFHKIKLGKFLIWIYSKI